jgi:hypothetical protein
MKKKAVRVRVTGGLEHTAVGMGKSLREDDSSFLSSRLVTLS